MNLLLSAVLVTHISITFSAPLSPFPHQQTTAQLGLFATSKSSLHRPEQPMMDFDITLKLGPWLFG